MLPSLSEKIKGIYLMGIYFSDMWSIVQKTRISILRQPISIRWFVLKKLRRIEIHFFFFVSYFPSTSESKPPLYSSTFVYSWPSSASFHLLSSEYRPAIFFMVCLYFSWYHRMSIVKFLVFICCGLVWLCDQLISTFWQLFSLILFLSLISLFLILFLNEHSTFHCSLCYP